MLCLTEDLKETTKLKKVMLDPAHASIPAKTLRILPAGWEGVDSLFIILVYLGRRQMLEEHRLGRTLGCLWCKR